FSRVWRSAGAPREPARPSIAPRTARRKRVSPDDAGRGFQTPVQGKARLWLRAGDVNVIAQYRSSVDGGGPMTVVCAWCESQGRTQVLREKEPFAYQVISHGICEEHARAFVAEVREAKMAAMSLDRRGQ